MNKNERLTGICLTCGNEIHCTFPVSRPSGVIECDEFHPEYGVSDRRSSAVSVAGGSHLKPASSDSTLVKGLCVNCERLASCTFPKPAGGVWHCEEYE